MEERAAFFDRVASRMGKWLHRLDPAVRNRESMELRNRSIIFETMSGLVGPGEPSMLLSTMRVSLSSEYKGDLFIEISPQFSIQAILGRKERSGSSRQLSIFCDHPEAAALVREQARILQKLESFKFNVLLFDEGVLRMKLPTVVHDERRKVAVGRLMLDFIERIEGDLGQ